MALIPDINQPLKKPSNNSISSTPVNKETTPKLTHVKIKKSAFTKKNSGDAKDVVGGKKKSSRAQKRKRLAIIVIVIVTILGILGGIIYKNATKLYSEAMQGKDEFEKAQVALTEQRFSEAATHLNSAEVHLSQAQQASNNLNWIKWIPWVSTQFDAVDNLLLGGAKAASGLEDISYLADEIFNAVKSDDTSLSNITPQQRKTILETFSNSPERLKQARQDLEMAVEALENVPDEGVISVLAVAIKPLKEKLPLAQQMVDKALPFLEVAPAIAGYPDEQTYLFLLQNNTELRPTGGFIGTYGVLALKNADIKEFKTDNIYNIDSPAKDELFVTPPEPFTTYLGMTQWFMRDANWHPDFPTTAQKVEEFYHLEKGPVEHFDGVIAVTPVVIQDLIDLTGPIVVEGEEYNSENFVEKLQYQVEVGYRQEGISDSARKEVIGKMAGELMKRVMNIPKNQWGDMMKIVMENLDQKHILIYSKNEKAQEMIENLEWAGAISEHTGQDYLMVVDANLGALKTDRLMHKNIEYAVTKQGDKYIIDVTLKYRNDGYFDHFTTRYRSYTRIYVPQGSTLIETKGFYTNDRLNGGTPTSAKVTQDDVIHKTVFEGFVSVEPQTEEVITLRYELPKSVTETINEGNYKAYIQKQPGTDNVTFSSKIDFGKTIENFEPIDKSEKIGNNEFRFSSPLDTDKIITIEYR